MPDGPRIGRASLRLVLAVLCAAAASAQTTSFGDPTSLVDAERFEGAPITLSVGAEWPAAHTGWIPVLIELTNEGDEERNVKLELRGRRDHGNEVIQVVTAPPGHTAVELVAPAFGMRRGYDLHATLGREVLELNVPSAEFQRGFLSPAVLVVSGGGITAAHEQFEWPSRTFAPSPHVPSEELRALSLGRTGFAGAPRRFEAYTSLSAVVLDLRADDRPPPELVDVLLAWVRTGGLLVLWHPDPLGVAGSWSGLAPWLEPRFEDEPGLFTVGLGHVLLADEDDWFARTGKPTTRQGRLFNDLVVEGKVRRVPIGGPGWFGVLTGMSELPYRALVFVLILFAILIGPVNFLVVKALRRQHLLLVTIPSIAAVASLALVVYGLVHQGLDVKRARFAYTVLDQREHRAATLATETLFAGWVPSSGIRPGPRSAVVPRSGGPFDSPAYLVELGAEKRLTGGFLPARRLARQTVFTESAARGRLAVEYSSGSLRVENGLGCRLRALALRDAGGALHFLRSPLEEGTAGELEQLSMTSREYRDFDQLLDWEQAVEADERRSTHAWMEFFEPSGPPPTPADVLPVTELDDLLPGTYLALVEGSPFADDLGLDAVATPGLELVLGILDLGELGGAGR